MPFSFHLSFRIAACAIALECCSSLQAETRFVDLASVSPLSPYTSWATAATSILDAVSVSMGDDLVLVTNGIHVLSGTVHVTNGIAVRSVNGPLATVVDGSVAGLSFLLGHSNAVVEGLTVRGGTGCGVYIAQGGTLRRCIVTENTSAGHGGGVYCDRGGVLESCLVYGNEALGLVGRGGGVYFYRGGAAENCTIAGNRAMNTGRGGGVSCDGGGTLRNCIIYGNTASLDANHNELSGGAYSYCCTYPSVGGVGNRWSDPLFVDAAGADYRLSAASSCIDTGTNLPWMVGALDLGGQVRRIGRSDMGAYESGQWFCDFTATPGAGIDQMKVVFRSELLGPDVGEMEYWWDLDGDGVTDRHGSGLNTVTNTYGFGGTYSVRLTVTNAVGQGAVHTESLVLPAARVFDLSPPEGTIPFTCVFSASPAFRATSGLYYSWDFNGDGTGDVSGVDRSVVSNVFPRIGIYSPSVTVSNLDGQVVGESKPNGIRTGPPAIYVSPTGGRVYPYTNWAAAARSISVAVSGAVAGATVYVTNGTYTSGATISLSNAVVVRSVNGAKVTAVDGGNAVRCFTLSHTGAVVRGFTIRRGRELTQGGGGVYLAAGGTVQDCILTLNLGYIGGGALLSSGGVLRNSLVCLNSAMSSGGGVFLDAGGEVESCTVSENQATNMAGGLIFNYGGVARNTIIFGNDAASARNMTTYGSYLLDHVWTSDPGFIDSALGKYRLPAISPCVDAGADQAWMAGTRDLDGADRIRGARVDIGAFEFGLLNYDFDAFPRQGVAPCQVSFVARPASTNSGGWHYSWDFNNDGVFDARGVDAQAVTNVYGVGQHSVRLVVSNQAGEVASLVRTNLIRVAPSVVYVSPVGSQVSPYTNWATAVRSIRTAMLTGVDGTVVLVTNGTYVLTAEIQVTNGIVIRSVNGPDVTIVSGNDQMRCFSLIHSNAAVQGFRIVRGKALTGGGGAALVTLGVLQDCVAVSNKARLGSAVYCGAGGTVRNCLLYDNHGESLGVSWGGGAHCEGTLDNCTIVSNTANRGGGVVIAAGCTIRNSIIHGNAASTSGANWEPYGGGTVAFSCTTPSIPGVGNITWAPQFRDPGKGDYRLQTNSFCVDTGSNLAWMAGACDLDGVRRIQSGTVDMGAYEVATDAFYAHPRYGVEPLVVSFTAVPSNPAPGTYFQWDFDGDRVWDAEGVDRATAAAVYPTGGLFSCTLSTRSPDGTTKVTTRDDYIYVDPSILYVSTAGGDRYPYANWAEAATNIQDALDASTDGDTILVSNGTYGVRSEVTVSQAVLMRSVNGPGVTAIDGGHTVRCVRVDRAGAVVEGFTIQGGWNSGGGLPASGGGVILKSGATVRRCVIRDNWDGYRGGGAYLDGGGTLENCLVMGNVCVGATYNIDLYGGGGVFMNQGGTVQNCTIVGNSVSNAPGGGLVRYSSGAVENCIIYSNRRNGQPDDLSMTGVIQQRYVTHCCTPQTVAGTGNITNAPVFADSVSFDYSLHASSPGVDAGTNRPWMTNTVDLAGSPRIANRRVDIGAYESPGIVLLTVTGLPWRVGTPTPDGYGAITAVVGRLVSNTVDAVVQTNQDTRYVNRGWAGTGSVPASGTTSSVSFVISSNSTLSWLWDREHWLGLSAENGEISGASGGWCPDGFIYDLSPSNAYGHVFHHWAVDGADAGTNVPLRLVMDAPHDVTAVFTSAFVDVTADVTCSFDAWVLNRQTGTFFGSLRVQNRLDSRKILMAPFWYALSGSSRVRLMHPSGVTVDGKPYVDVTSKVLAALPAVGNHDLVLDPGESVVISGIEVYSYDRSVPQGFVFALWADPPNSVGAAASFADTDGDGVPNGWEAAHGLCENDPNDGARDSDGDGASNRNEYQADTDPLDPRSCLRILAVEQGTEGNTRLRWAGGTQATQYLERSDDLMVWLTVFTNRPPSAISNSFDRREVAPHGFFRLRVGPR